MREKLKRKEDFRPGTFVFAVRLVHVAVSCFFSFTLPIPCAVYITDLK